LTEDLGKKEDLLTKKEEKATLAEGDWYQKHLKVEETERNHRSQTAKVQTHLADLCDNINLVQEMAEGFDTQESALQHNLESLQEQKLSLAD
jgi:hypothetical protein